MKKLFILASLILAAPFVLSQHQRERELPHEFVMNHLEIFTFIDAYEILGEDRLFFEHEMLIRNELSQLRSASGDQRIEGIKFGRNGFFQVDIALYPQLDDINYAILSFTSDLDIIERRSMVLRSLINKGFLMSDVHFLEFLWTNGPGHLDQTIESMTQQTIQTSHHKNMSEPTKEQLENTSDEEYLDYMNFSWNTKRMITSKVLTTFFCQLSHPSQRAILSSLMERYAKGGSGQMRYKGDLDIGTAREQRLGHIKNLTHGAIVKEYN